MCWLTNTPLATGDPNILRDSEPGNALYLQNRGINPSIIDSVVSHDSDESAAVKWAPPEELDLSLQDWESHKAHLPPMPPCVWWTD